VSRANGREKKIVSHGAHGVRGEEKDKVKNRVLKSFPPWSQRALATKGSGREEKVSRVLAVQEAEPRRHEGHEEERLFFFGLSEERWPNQNQLACGKRIDELRSWHGTMG
jgi:hypothetical protein